ncbi:UNVERIFIED_CONTAM: hypothetical protein K2H54_059250 [Gekko kuhli]
MASAPSKPAPRTKPWKSGVCVLCRGPFKNAVIIDGLKLCRFCFANVKKEALAKKPPPSEDQNKSKREAERKREEEEEKKKGLCEEHGERLIWFCTQEKAPICEACQASKTHASHTVVPAEEAAQEYKSKLQQAAPLLEQHLEKALKLKHQEGKKTAEWKAGALS